MRGHGGGHGAEPARPDGSDEEVVGWNCMQCGCLPAGTILLLSSFQKKKRKAN